jgi:hypothetical protein
VANSVWVVRDDQRIAAIQKAFLEVQFLYIADGHHRAAAAAAVARLREKGYPTQKGIEEYNFFANVSVQVKLGMTGWSEFKRTNGERISAESESLVVTGILPETSSRHHGSMYLEEGLCLHVKDAIPARDLIRTPDVASPGQPAGPDPASGPGGPTRIKFVGSTWDACRTWSTEGVAVAFLCTTSHPGDGVADSGQIMP